VYCRKVAKNFGQWDFLQHAKKNDERFRTLFVGENWAKVMIVELCPKIKKMPLPAFNKRWEKQKENCVMVHKEALNNQDSAINENQHRFTTEDTKSTEKERVRQRAEALVRRIGETCDELDRLAEENPELVRRVTRGAEEHKDAYVRLKARLELADEAPRCRWVRQDGTSCGSPQMKKHIYCFAHRQMMEARALALSLPAPEDANAIQIGIMRIQKALIEGSISTKAAGLLLYSMQLALQNVGQVTFGQAKTQELVRETVDENEAFSQNQTPTTETRRHGEERGQHQTFETQRNGGSGGKEGLPLISTDDTDKEKGLPRMDADERGLELPTPLEWRPSADMFRMDTREGVEAYEASLRTKMPRQDQAGTPSRVAVPHEDRQVHANLG
jgi:hypothetical protein